MTETPLDQQALLAEVERLRGWLRYIADAPCYCQPPCSERGADIGCEIGAALQALAGTAPPDD